MNSKNKKMIVIFSILLFICLNIFVFTYKDKSGQYLGFVRTIRNLFFAKNNNLTAREILNFNYDWEFSKGQGTINSQSDIQSENVIYIADVTSGTLEENIPYSLSYIPGNTWESVSLPHTYNDVDTFNNYEETNNNGERSMYTGTSWYKKTFFIDNEYANKRFYIEFEGVRQAAKVYLNGVLIPGTHEDGFIAFGYDLTDYINVGENNYITVMVDNSFPYYIEGTNSKVPWHDSHWHPTLGGISQNVNFYIMDNLHLTLPLYSFIETEGTYIYTNNETTDSATVNVDAEIENSYGTAKTFKVRSRVLNILNENVLTITSENVTLDPNSKTTVNLSGVLNDVIWYSTEYPYLYTVRTEILDLDNNVIDDNEYKMGVRTFRITNDEGFYLNENNITLNGWGQKSTMEWAGLGTAYPNWMHDFVIKKMKDANANYIRFGHTAATSTQIEMADKYGLLVTQPGVDSEGESAGSIYNTNAYRLRFKAMRDLIIYFRNSTSIISWEISNHYSGLSKIADDNFLSSINGIDFTREPGETITYGRLFYEIINKYDYGNREDSRNNAGSYNNTTPSSNRFISIRRGDASLIDYVDVGETTEGTGGMLTLELGNKPAIEGEYNRLEARRGVWDYSTPGYENFYNQTSSGEEYRDVTSEEFAVSQAIKYAEIYQGTNYVGGANWIFSDSISHGRVTSEVARASGEVDATMLEKEAYWVNKVLFSEEPSVYIIGHWNYPSGTVKDIYVVANNVYNVELYINDNIISEATELNQFLYKFENVEYATGTIRAEGKSFSGETIATNSITSHGAATKLRITPITNANGLLANGSDILLLDIEVLDANNNRVITFDGVRDNILTTFYVNENVLEDTAVWRGSYNSSIPGSTNSQTIKIESGIVRVALRTTRTPGTIKVRVETPNLTGAEFITSSSEVINTNGFYNTLDTTPAYSLEGLTVSSYGTGITPTGGETANIIGSTLINNFSYTGNRGEFTGIYDALSVGKKAYSDLDVTFTNVPFEYLNAEYLRIPSTDNSPSLSADLIDFTAKKDIDVLLFIDRAGQLPDWATESGFTSTTQTVTTSAMKTYDVYSLPMTKNSNITLGSNSSLTSMMYIVAFKETSYIDNGIFFKEDFTDFDDVSLLKGWNLNPGTGNYATIENINSNNVLRLISNSETSLAYVQKRFAPQYTEFTVTFDAYVTSDAPNTYLRVWFGNGLIKREDDKDNLNIETYLSRQNSKLSVTSRLSPSVQVNNLYSQGLLDVVNNYKYVINVENKTYDLFINNVMVASNIDFIDNGNTANYIDSFVFGTGKGTKSNLYIDNFEIIPDIEDILTGITIDGNNIENFSSANHNYEVDYAISDHSVVSVIGNSFYKSHTTSYDKGLDKITINALTVADTEKVYEITSSVVSPLEGYTILEETSTSIDVVEIDGRNAIHIVDESCHDTPAKGKYAYFSKEFSNLTDKFILTFDAKLTSGTPERMNQYNRIWLTDGEMVNNKENVGVESYLHNNKTTQYYDFVARSNKDETLIYLKRNIVFNEWNSYKYEVDVPNHTMNVYVNDMDNPVSSDVKFFENIDQINHLTIATGMNFLSDLYIDNINITLNAPLTNISVNSAIISDFDINTQNYQVSSNLEFTNNTQIDVIRTPSYQRHTVTNNFDNNTSTVVVYDLLNKPYTYQITHNYILSSTKTRQQLIDYIDYINDTYIETDYTDNTWALLEDSIANAQAIIDNPNSIEDFYTLAYYELEESVNGLLLPVINNAGITELIDLKIYSSDLLNNYQYADVLEKGGLVYFNNSTTFTSVPYKYLNAEYLKIPINYLNHGMISITPEKAITMLVFKDREAGTFTKTGFSFTGDIVTSSLGTVYKVYSKSITTMNEFTIYLDEYILNNVTNIGNVIAFVATDKLTNNYFINENFSNYRVENDYNELENGWQIYAGTNSSASVVDVTLNNVDGRYLKLQSNSTTTMSFANKQFAKLDDKFSFKYKVYVDSSTQASNDYIRIWLTKGAAEEEAKGNVLIETYAGYKKTTPPNTNYGLVIRHKDAPNVNNLIQGFNQNTWMDIEYTVDMLNNTFKVKIGEENGVLTDLTSDYKFLVYNLGQANYMSFASRKSNTSLSYFKDISITPITRKILSNVSVDGTNVINFHELTNAYLHYYDAGDSLNVVSSQDVNYSEQVINNSNSNYTEITAKDDSNYEYNYKVYYELNVNKTNLSNIYEEAIILKPYRYTIASYSVLTARINEAKTILQDVDATQNEVDTAYSNLNNAMSTLVLLVDSLDVYEVKTAMNKEYDDFVSESVKITNKSSFTINYLINRTYLNGYDYSALAHIRYLTTSFTLPENTIITMLDNSESTYKVYYYEVTANDYLNDKRNFPLTDFVLMGSDIHYTNKVYYSNNILYENFNFIFNLKNNTNIIPTANYVITLNLEVDNVISSSNALISIIEEESTITNSIVIDNQTYISNSMITIPYEIIVNNPNQYHNTQYDDKKIGYQISLLANNEFYNIPQGFKFIIGENSCYKENDGKCRLIANNNVISSSGSLIIDLEDYYGISADNLSLKVETFISDDGINLGEIIDTKVLGINIESDYVYNLKIELDNYDNKILQYGESNDIMFNIDTTGNIEQLSSYITVSLKSKNSETSNYSLLDLHDYTTDFVTDIEHLNEYILPITQGNVSIHLDNNLPRGTYKIEFKLYTTGIDQEVRTEDYLFIVK